MTTKYLRSAITAVNDIINRTVKNLSESRLATKAMELKFALESIAAIYTTTMTVADMAEDLGGSAIANQVRVLRELADDVRIKGEQVHHWNNPEHALEGMDETIRIYGKGIAQQMDLLLNQIEQSNQPAAPERSPQDERAIRRAVWSSFYRKGHCKCPYPIGHADREIWADETAAIAAEFSETIIPPAPTAVSIANEEFERDFGTAIAIFCTLLIGNVFEGEVLPIKDIEPFEMCLAR